MSALLTVKHLLAVMAVAPDSAVQLGSTTAPVAFAHALASIETYPSALAAGSSEAFVAHCPLIPAANPNAVTALLATYSGTTGLPSLTTEAQAAGAITLRIANSCADAPLNGKFTILLVVAQ